MANEADATAVNPKVIDFLRAIRQSRATIRDNLEIIFQRAQALQGVNAESPEAVERASIELETAKIQLAEAEIAILKAGSRFP